MRRLLLGTRTTIAGTVYGTIVVLAAIAAGASTYQDDLWRLGAVVTVTVLVLWLAHVYAHGLAESLEKERRLQRGELARIAAREFSIPLAAVLPLAAIGLGALDVFEGNAAVWLALGLGVATLTAQGLRYARLEQLSGLGTFVSVTLNLLLGLSIVALKTFVTH
jgi:hypothetical protein